jgi:CshA-type fibril repeat protein/VCBS repeat-containing protein
MKLPRRSRASHVRRLATATFVAAVIAIAGIRAQDYGVFEEGFEGEIWELRDHLPIVGSTTSDTFAAGVAYINGELFVADNYNGTITKYDDDHEIVDLPFATWNGVFGTPTNPANGTGQWAPNELTSATIRINGGAPQAALLVSDSANSRLYMFTTSGAHLFTLYVPADDTIDPYLHSLNGIAMGPGAYFALNEPIPPLLPTLQLVGSMATAWAERFGPDANSGAVLAFKDRTFSYEGIVLDRFDAGQPDAQLAPVGFENVENGVTGVAFDSAGNLYALDGYNGRVNAYNSSFAHLFTFGTPSIEGDPLSPSEEFLEPYGMTLWPSSEGDRLLISDPFANRAVVYRPNLGAQTLDYLFKLDGLGDVNGFPHASAFDPVGGRVAVSDSINEEVLVFQSPALAIFDLKVFGDPVGASQADNVCMGGAFNVRFSITVPEGRSDVQMITPQLLINGQPAVYDTLTASGPYPTEDVGDVGSTTNPPLEAGQVLTYTYRIIAPAAEGELNITAGAIASTTSQGGNGEYAQLDDILYADVDFPVVDCSSGNDAPTVVASVPTAPSNISGWTKIEPPAPAAVNFPITLTATDSDGSIIKFQYQLMGTNQSVVTDVPVSGAPSEAVINVPLTQPGVSTISFRAQDNGLLWSPWQQLEVKLDNSLPNICMVIPYGEPIPIFNGQNQITGYKYWWNGPVTINISANDSFDTSPDFVNPPPQMLPSGTAMLFNLEGFGQSAALTVVDHVGHTRTLASNTPLDVCGPGLVGTNVNIDLTNPTVQSDTSDAAIYQSPKEIVLTATDPPGATPTRVNDGFSEVRYIEHREVGETVWIRNPGPTAIVLTESTSLEFRSIDWAGNISGTVQKNYVVNRAPVAGDDSYTTNEDTPITIAAPGLLTNDSDPDEDSLSVTVNAPGPQHGVLTLNGGGGFTYTPHANYHGPDSFTYTLSDGRGGSDTATVGFTINSVNDAPVATANSYSTNEDIPTSGNVLTDGVDDSDADNDSLTAELVSTTANGALVFNSDGTFSYTPNLNFNGTDSFTYNATDGTLDSNVATVTITVIAVNDTPVATPNSYTTNEDIAATGNVLTDGVPDSDVDGNTLTAELVATTANGALVLNPNGVFTYTPNPNFHGTDSFTYNATDGTADSNVVTVTITVIAVNDAPVATPNSYSTSEDTAVSGNVLTDGVDDSDADGDPLLAELVSTTANGILVFSPDGTFSYTPNLNFNGTDSFTYNATDGTADSNVVTVTITIAAVNDAPVATNNSYATVEDTTTPVTGNVLTDDPDDSDVDGDGLTAQLVSSTANGALTLNANGTFSYQPNLNFNGTDSFTYQANDGALDSNVATVTITVAPVNDAPVATDNSYATVEDTTTPATGNVLTDSPADSDVDHDVLTAVLVSNTANGVLTLSPNGSFSYLPNPNFSGTDSFVYKARDGQADSNTATVTITVAGTNDAPTATNNAYSTNEDAVKTGNVLTDSPADSDPDGDTLTAVLVATTSNGSLVLNPNGTFTYTPNPNFFGSDSFTYMANDGHGANSNVATVTITVNPVNDAPVATNNAYTTVEDSPTATTGNVLTDGVPDSDVEGDALTAVLGSTTGNGALILNPDGSFSYTANPNFNGVDTFTYRANDGQANSNLATVTIRVNPANDAPVAGDDTASTPEDTAVTIARATLIANDNDGDGDTLTITSVQGAVNGTAVLDGGGVSVTFTPAADFNGTASFTYTVSDGNGGSDTATVTVTVTAVNDTPVAVNDAAATNEDTPLTVLSARLLDNDDDVDGDTLTITSVQSPVNGTVTLNPGGTSVTFTPTANFSGTASFTYTVSDGNGGTATATVTVTVNEVNDPPTALPDSATTPYATPVTIAVLANDSAGDVGDVLAIQSFSNLVGGTAVANGDGTMTFTPASGFSGTASFTYTVQDSGGLTASTFVTVEVGPANVAPVAVADTYATRKNQTLTVAAPGVLANDTDADGDTMTAVLVSGPTSGTLTLNANGSFTFVPQNGFSGTVTFTYQAKDTSDQLSNIVTVTITVSNTAPTCSAATGGQIWPPNHKKFFVAPVYGVTDPDGDPVTITVTGIWQDELLDSTGDGKFAPDGRIEAGTAWVRAERNGVENTATGNGRVYEILFTAVDNQAAVCHGSVFWTVPHDQGQGATAIDSGVRYDSTGTIPGVRSKEQIHQNSPQP